MGGAFSHDGVAVKFWTIQPVAVWAKMKRGEPVRVDPNHPKYGGVRPWQYDWLATTLAHHLPGFSGGWPWWLSCDEPDVAQLASSTLPGGIDQASIELELPEERYITFPLWMWETIYTGEYLAASHEELNGWHQESLGMSAADARPLPEPRQARLEVSWEQIFDPAWRPRFWYRDQAPPDDGSQLSRLMREASASPVGLTEELRLSDVVRVSEFTSN